MRKNLSRFNYTSGFLVDICKVLCDNSHSNAFRVSDMEDKRKPYLINIVDC